jgi:hypothetical protein
MFLLFVSHRKLMPPAAKEDVSPHLEEHLCRMTNIIFIFGAVFMIKRLADDAA